MKIASVLLFFLSIVPFSHAQEYLDCHQVPGWEPAGQKHEYAADNLYDYKDGGSEGYLIYGFVRMRGISCSSAGSTLVIDVSEMNDADGAYGLLSSNTDPSQPIEKIGMGGQIQKQSAIFAKGKYYVELVVQAESQDADRRPVIEAFVRQIQTRLEGCEEIPETMGWFAKEDLVSTQLVPESVLGLRMLKRGYVAKYKQGQAFLVAEETPDAASVVFKKLRERFTSVTSATMGEEAFQGKVQYLDGICVFRKGRYIGGYTNSSNPQAAVAAAAKLLARLP